MRSPPKTPRSPFLIICPLKAECKPQEAIGNIPLQLLLPDGGVKHLNLAEESLSKLSVGKGVSCLLGSSVERGSHGLHGSLRASRVVADEDEVAQLECRAGGQRAALRTPRQEPCMPPATRCQVDADPSILEAGVPNLGLLGAEGLCLACRRTFWVFTWPFLCGERGT